MLYSLHSRLASLGLARAASRLEREMVNSRSFGLQFRLARAVRRHAARRFEREAPYGFFSQGARGRFLASGR